ncbi:SiaB family protein kinase [Pseudoduganella sp. RAF19]|uniref:SiaB family protein kinase n=1 Tax=Pseudoduganella sp. RAF19 TaxID=3233052 RepID=UPI003F9CCEF5
MLYEEFEDFWQVAQKRHVIFFYTGYFSQHVVAAISETIRARLDTAGAAGPTRRRIFSAFVEMSQNIMHYSSESLTPDAERDQQMRRGSFCIGSRDDNFFLLSANPVHTDRVESIRTRLEPLRTMTVEEIKLAYKKALREAAPEDSKGAGLGFLTMAREASEPLEFEFVPAPNKPDTTIFCIKAII